MADLPTNYLDDILSDSMGGKRRYKITHLNGTSEEVTIEDISKYDQVGSTFGAGDINRTNQAVNEKLDSADVVDPALATVLGFAADAKLTGDALSELNKKIGVVGDLQNITNNFPYTVPKDGLLYISIISELSTVAATLYINGLFGGAINARIIASGGGSVSGFYICKKDDVLQIANKTNVKSNYIGFIPLA